MSSFNLNLDPKILDQDKLRLTKRKKLLKFISLPIIFLTFISLFFLRTGVLNLVINSANSTLNYKSLKTVSNFQLLGNLIEPYLAYYDRGFANLTEASSLEDLITAEADFRESLKNNPPEAYLCYVYGNLSYTLELEADLTLKTSEPEKSLILYNRAESLLSENDCLEKEEKAKSAKERIEEKRREAVNEINNIKDDNEQDDGKADDSGKEIDDKKLDEIHSERSDLESRAAGILRYSVGRGSSSDRDWNAPNF